MTLIDKFSIQVADGFDEISSLVDEYKERQEVAKQAEKRFTETNDSLKSYMVSCELTELVVGQDVVTLQEVTRETIDSKIAKALIPKKYLDNVTKISHYTRLLIAPVKK